MFLLYTSLNKPQLNRYVISSASWGSTVCPLLPGRRYAELSFHPSTYSRYLPGGNNQQSGCCFSTGHSNYVNARLNSHWFTGARWSEMLEEMWEIVWVGGRFRDVGCTVRPDIPWLSYTEATDRSPITDCLLPLLSTATLQSAACFLVFLTSSRTTVLFAGMFADVNTRWTALETRFGLSDVCQRGFKGNKILGRVGEATSAVNFSWPEYR